MAGKAGGGRGKGEGGGGGGEGSERSQDKARGGAWGGRGERGGGGRGGERAEGVRGYVFDCDRARSGAHHVIPLCAAFGPRGLTLLKPESDTETVFELPRGVSRDDDLLGTCWLLSDESKVVSAA